MSLQWDKAVDPDGNDYWVGFAPWGQVTCGPDHVEAGFWTLGVVAYGLGFITLSPASSLEEAKARAEAFDPGPFMDRCVSRKPKREP